MAFFGLFWPIKHRISQFFFGELFFLGSGGPLETFWSGEIIMWGGPNSVPASARLKDKQPSSQEHVQTEEEEDTLLKSVGTPMISGKRKATDSSSSLC